MSGTHLVQDGQAWVDGKVWRIEEVQVPWVEGDPPDDWLIVALAPVELGT